MIVFLLGNFITEGEDHLVFPIGERDAEALSECGIYPTIEETLESFTPEDVRNVATIVTNADGSREPCNIEWIDYIDEVISALHDVSDLPVALQVALVK